MTSYGCPAAIARIQGSTPQMRGFARFIPHGDGTLVVVEMQGLPPSETGFFALHIHENGDCRGEGFPNTGGHDNPGGAPHPSHAGDLPPLLSDGGEAYLAVATGRFRVREVLGKSIVVHSRPDDFHTQPSGDAGTKIACGVIRPAR